MFCFGIFGSHRTEITDTSTVIKKSLNSKRSCIIVRIVQVHTYLQGRRTRGCSRCTCTPTFIQSPKFYSIKCCIGENSPKFSGNAPALFRALRRQYECAKLWRSCRGVGKKQSKQTKQTKQTTWLNMISMLHAS